MEDMGLWLEFYGRKEASTTRFDTAAAQTDDFFFFKKSVGRLGTHHLNSGLTVELSNLLGVWNWSGLAAAGGLGGKRSAMGDSSPRSRGAKLHLHPPSDQTSKV